VTGKRKQRTCSSKISEKLRENLKIGGFEIDGVQNKNNIGKEKMHISKKLHFSLIFDEDPH